MISLPILRQDFKINTKPILVTYAVQFVCLLLAAGIRSMRLIEISDIFWDTLPVLVIPIGMIMVLAYQLIDRCEEEKTMDFILATSITPQSVVLTKSLFLILTVLALDIFSVLLGCAGNVYDLTGVWGRNAYLQLNAGGFCMQLFWCGYCMMISAAGKRNTPAFYWKAGAAVPVLFYAVYLLYYLIPELFFLKYVTVFSLFQQHRFAAPGVMNTVRSLILLAGGGVCFGMAGHIFCKRHPQS